MKAGKDRNHSKRLRAIKWFTLLNKTYPDSPHAEQIQDKIEGIQKNARRKREIYIGEIPTRRKKNYKGRGAKGNRKRS